MRSSRVLRAVSALAVVFAVSTVLALPSVASEVASEPTTTRVSVLSSQVWTDTGVRVRAGELVEIHARGRIDFGPSRIDRMTPAGIARQGGCRGATSAEPWPAPTLSCWALIGKVGSAPPFEIGASRVIRMTSSGELFLGVNDNHAADNSGSWSADLSVTSGAARSNDDSSTLKKTAIAVGGLVALIALFALLVARRRRAPRHAAEAQPTEAELRELAAVVAGRIDGDILPEPRGHAPAVPTPTPAVVAVKGGPTDVNIFEVEFPDSATLRVGYSYFPEATTVRWLVRQGATTAATGQFVTSGGGEANHFVTIVLGTELRLMPEPADVDFTWEIGGVPFGYSVRRDPVT